MSGENLPNKSRRNFAGTRLSAELAAATLRRLVRSPIWPLQAEGAQMAAERLPQLCSKKNSIPFAKDGITVGLMFYHQLFTDQFISNKHPDDINTIFPVRSVKLCLFAF
jgi:hypothetical protein